MTHWSTKAKDLLLVLFVCPPTFVYVNAIISVIPRDWLKTTSENTNKCQLDPEQIIKKTNRLQLLTTVVKSGKFLCSSYHT